MRGIQQFHTKVLFKNMSVFLAGAAVSVFVVYLTGKNDRTLDVMPTANQSIVLSKDAVIEIKKLGKEFSLEYRFRGSIIASASFENEWRHVILANDIQGERSVDRVALTMAKNDRNLVTMKIDDAGRGYTIFDDDADGIAERRVYTEPNRKARMVFLKMIEGDEKKQ